MIENVKYQQDDLKNVNNQLPFKKFKQQTHDFYFLKNFLLLIQSLTRAQSSKSLLILFFHFKVFTEVPEEQCTLEPQKECKQVTKLVPLLKPAEECVDIPKEVCVRQRINPRRVQKPVIKKWCYTPTIETEFSSRPDSQPTPRFVCLLLQLKLLPITNIGIGLVQ